MSVKDKEYQHFSNPKRIGTAISDELHKRLAKCITIYGTKQAIFSLLVEDLVEVIESNKAAFYAYLFNRLSNPKKPNRSMVDKRILEGCHGGLERAEKEPDRNGHE